MTSIITLIEKKSFSDSLGLDDASPLNSTFSEKVVALGPNFYNDIVSSPMVFQLKYNLFRQTIRSQLSQDTVNKDLLIDQLVDAIALAQILEHVHAHYLDSSWEASRIRKQRKIYLDILAKMNALPKHFAVIAEEQDEAAFSQKVRENTIECNPYRLLIVRSKRALDMFATAEYSADWYRNIISKLDKRTNFLFAHLGWAFFVPRLAVNLTLLLKHTVPGPWMKDKEKSLDWKTRFGAQLQNRWFELGNDLAWINVGIIQCVLLTGALAPMGIYLSVAFFAFDVLMSLGRAYIELNRLYTLRAQYLAITANSDEESLLIKEHLQALQKQIEFETLRLGIHLLSTVGILLSVACALPMFVAISPIIPLAGAVALVVICLINIALIVPLEKARPNDRVEVPHTMTELPKKESQKYTFFAVSTKAPAPEAPGSVLATNESTSPCW